MTRMNLMMRISPAPQTPLLIGLFALAALASACKDEPTSTWAKEEAYPAHKATLNAVEAKVGGLFEAFAPAPFESFEPSKAADMQAAQTARMKRFDEQATAAMKAYPEVIGWEASYAFPEVEKVKVTYNFDTFSKAVPSYKAAATLRADPRKFKVDETVPIGWGMYQIPGKENKVSLGMDVPQYYKGIETISTLPHKDAVLTLRTFFVDPALHKDAPTSD